MKDLSPRESEVIELAITGLTNEGIAHELDLSIGTVNTYWLRIRMKVGGAGRTDTVAKVIKERSEVALRKANVDLDHLTQLLIEKEHSLVEAKASIALLEMALEHNRSTVWATSQDLTLIMVGNGEMTKKQNGANWETGKTIWEVFVTEDPENPAIQAHVDALKGQETTVRLSGDFSNMVLNVTPLRDENHEVVGCFSIMKHRVED